MFTFPITLWQGQIAGRTFVSNTASAGSGTTFNFTSLAFGTAAGTSLVAVIVHAGSNGTGLSSLSSATIGGVGATIHAQTHGGSAGILEETVCAVISAVTSSTSGTVSLTFNNNAGAGAGVEVYRLNNLTSTTPNATATANSGSGTAGSLSTTINITGSGILLWGATAEGDVSNVVSLSGVTRDVHQGSGGGGIDQMAGGSLDGLATQSNRSVSASWSSSAVASSAAGATWN